MKSEREFTFYEHLKRINELRYILSYKIEKPIREMVGE